uniref:Uncharacterized protein n=1 Tax=Panagrolaimus sp. PS1159 TaxID=55785 RepID=A0AC35GY64_9BILA
MSENDTISAAVDAATFSYSNGTDIIAWKGANTAFLIVLFTAIPLMAGLVSLLVCKLYGLRRIVAPMNNFDGIDIELPLSPTTLLSNEKRGNPI